MIKCKWWLESYSKLAKAHIIPEAFFRNYSVTGGRIYDANSFSKLSRIGWYDNTISCASCEKKLQSIDDKAVKILLKDFNKIKVISPLNPNVLQIPKSITQDLKRFFTYTLWKCSVSSLPEFERVKLGPYEDIIKSALTENTYFSDDDFSFVGQYHLKPVGFTSPFKCLRKDFGGRVYYHLDLSTFGVDIKVDKQPATDPWRSLSQLDHVAFFMFNTPPRNKIKAMRKILFANAAFERSAKEKKRKL